MWIRFVSGATAIAFLVGGLAFVGHVRATSCNTKCGTIPCTDIVGCQWKDRTWPLENVCESLQAWAKGCNTSSPGQTCSEDYDNQNQVRECKIMWAYVGSTGDKTLCTAGTCATASAFQGYWGNVVPNACHD